MSEMQKYTMAAYTISYPGPPQQVVEMQPAKDGPWYSVHDVDARLALMQRALEWCLENAATIGDRWSNDRQRFYPGVTDQGGRPLEVPADLAPIICLAKRGDGNG